MAIEPISTIGTVQMQSAVKVQPVDNNSTSTATVSEQSATPMLDETTPMVAKAAESSTDNKQDNKKEADQESLKKAVESINKNMANTEAVFGIHEGTNRVTIKIVDKQTKEVIKELPPEKTLDMIAKAWEMAGLMVDEKR